MTTISSFQLTTSEEVSFVRKQLGTSEADVKEAVRLLRDWLNNQPHLPNSIDDSIIERMYINCKCRMDRVKVALDAYFSLKHRFPELLMNRDPLDPDIVYTMNRIKTLTMPRLTAEGYRVHINFGYSSDPETIRFRAYMKVAVMLVELLLAEDYSLGDVVIVDVSAATVAHLPKVDVRLIRALELCSRIAYCRRLKGLHLVNAPTVIHIVLKIVKSCISGKLQRRVFTHLPGSRTLFDHVPRDFVPDELGGTAGPAERFNNLLYEKVCKCRKWFLEQDKYVSDEARRPRMHGSASVDEVSFRKLAVD